MRPFTPEPAPSAAAGNHRDGTDKGQRRGLSSFYLFYFSFVSLFVFFSPYMCQSLLPSFGLASDSFRVFSVSQQAWVLSCVLLPNLALACTAARVLDRRVQGLVLGVSRFVQPHPPYTSLSAHVHLLLQGLFFQSYFALCFFIHPQFPIRFYSRHQGHLASGVIAFFCLFPSLFFSILNFHHSELKTKKCSVRNNRSAQVHSMYLWCFWQLEMVERFLEGSLAFSVLIPDHWSHGLMDKVLTCPFSLSPSFIFSCHMLFLCHSSSLLCHPSLPCCSTSSPSFSFSPSLFFPTIIPPLISFTFTLTNSFVYWL